MNARSSSIFAHGQRYADLQKYVANRDAEVEAGATHYTLFNVGTKRTARKKFTNFPTAIEMEILYNYYYEHDSADENNYSVCLMINQGDRHFLFNGDLEEKGKRISLETTPCESRAFQSGTPWLKNILYG